MSRPMLRQCLRPRPQFLLIGLQRQTSSYRKGWNAWNAGWSGQKPFDPGRLRSDIGRAKLFDPFEEQHV